MDSSKDSKDSPKDSIGFYRILLRILRDSSKDSSKDSKGFFLRILQDSSNGSKGF